PALAAVGEFDLRFGQGRLEGLAGHAPSPFRSRLGPGPRRRPERPQAYRTPRRMPMKSPGRVHKHPDGARRPGGGSPRPSSAKPTAGTNDDRSAKGRGVPGAPTSRAVRSPVRLRRRTRSFPAPRPPSRPVKPRQRSPGRTAPAQPQLEESTEL